MDPFTAWLIGCSMGGCIGLLAAALCFSAREPSSCQHGVILTHTCARCEQAIQTFERAYAGESHLRVLK